MRYADNIPANFKSQNHIRFFVNRLKSHSILNFTTEEMQNNKFHFLDIALTVQPNVEITTAAYVKPTEQGIYTNHFSHSPDMYKYSIIKTLVTRALKYSSSWHEFNVEIGYKSIQTPGQLRPPNSDPPNSEPQLGPSQLRPLPIQTPPPPQFRPLPIKTTPIQTPHFNLKS